MTTLRLLLPRIKRNRSIFVNTRTLIISPLLGHSNDAVPFVIPLDWLVKLFIFHGTLYFETVDEQTQYCRYLSSYPKPRTKHEEEAFEKGWIAVDGFATNQRECFHEILEKDVTVEIEYEVLAGGDSDISYWFYSPENRILQSELKKHDGHQTLKLEETGEYRFCFDNSFSRFSQKQVYFSLRSLYEQGKSDNVTEDWMNSTSKDDLGELQNKFDDIKSSFQRIWNNMEAAQRYQNIFKMFEMHDRVVIENSFDRVNFWSIINSTLMFIVTIIQVITIRSLFENKSAYGKFLRGKNTDTTNFIR
ncbi:unnamed protein product [Rotaria magnacalcarata]|uniref:GOLD domain-containing protein n=3 Tax=Rotaria magnacalcarata TaxID=392030 RepID=A0A815Z594_9BILA|nr:unnamed protein product [Rotaria magnacalcarata]CAF3893868.1 unnamed protein product [Rotaria magnacalcarata]